MADALKIEVSCSTQPDARFEPNCSDISKLQNSLAHSMNIAVETVMASQSIAVDKVDVIVRVGPDESDYHFGPRDFVSGERVI